MQLPCPPPVAFKDRSHAETVRAGRQQFVTRILASCALGLVCLVSINLTATAQSSTEYASPDFHAVIAAVESYFASVKDFRASDLIKRSQIEGVLRSVEDTGWKVRDADAIVAAGLDDNSFLVSELSTPAGRRFMRKIAGQPGSYSRLDRLSSISGGRAIVRDLVRQPGGDELVRYLATTSGGKNLGSALGGARQGVDLNKPTGRIYTAVDLIAVLKSRVSQ